MIGVNLGIKKNKRGFTLMEMVVALGIFAIATTYALGIFVRSNIIQKRTANVQRLVADARYSMEIMAREVRSGSIDYSYGGYTLPLSSPQSVLAVLDSEGQPIRFRRAEVDTGRYALQVCYSDVCQAEDWLEITPDYISVNRLAFYITPDKDPFTWNVSLVDYNNDSQPMATIVMETVSTFRDSEETKIANFQTTVTSRKYVR